MEGEALGIDVIDGVLPSSLTMGLGSREGVSGRQERVEAYDF